MPIEQTIPRRVLTIFFILETSDRMNQNGEIDLMNEQMRGIIADLKNTAKVNPDAEMKVAVLEFNTTTRWITKSPVDFSEFHWQDLKAGGGVDYEKVLVALDEKLSRRKFMYCDTGQFRPIIIFITKDGPMEGDYQVALRKIRKENRWFCVAAKIAIVIGENEAEGLIDIVGTSEAVFRINQLHALKYCIKFVTINSLHFTSCRDTIPIEVTPTKDRVCVDTPYSPKHTFLRLPSGTIEIFEGCELEVKVCQLRCCEPKDAMTVVVKLMLIDEPKSVYSIPYLKVTNCSDFNLVHKYPLYEGQSINSKSEESVRIIIDSDYKVADQYDVLIENRESGIRIQNLLETPVWVRQTLVPGKEIVMRENGELLPLDDKWKVSFQNEIDNSPETIIECPPDWEWDMDW